MKKKRIALFVAGTLIFTTGLAAHLNKKQSETFAGHVTAFSESIEEDDYLIAAHRGFSSLEVENTKEAFALAASKNYVDYIEMDARLTYDNRIVLSHNNNIMISSDMSVDVSSLTYDEIKERSFYYSSMPSGFFLWKSPEKGFLISRYFNLTGKEYEVCDLLEGIKACGDKKILLDLKFQYDQEELCEELIHELEGVDTSNIVFQSLDIRGIRYLKEHSDFNCLALLDSKSDLSYIGDFENVGIKASLLTPEVCERLFQNDGLVAVWTIDTTDELSKVCSSLGDHEQDVIYITDVPDLIATKLDEKQLVLEP